MAKLDKKTAESAATAAAAKKKKITLIAVAAAVLVIGILAGIFVPKLMNKNTAASETVTTGSGCYADIEIKDYGKITFKLETEKAPITTANFIELANSGFYDGLTFHRIISGFMMQGGDPKGNGTGGSDKNIVGEFQANGYNTGLSHTRGAVSMARSSAYNSASSQFFIVHEDSTFLDGQYAVFGYVTEGMDVVDKVCTDAKPTDNNGTISAANQPVITSIKIRYE